MTKSKARLCVEVDDAHMEKMDIVADALQSCGMKVEQVSKLSGSIFGTADDDKIAKLKQVTGVRNVGKDQIFQLPPDDGETPQ